MTNKRVKYDKYCWRCSSKSTTLKCSNCVRAFHKKCVPIDGSDALNDTNWLCPVCAVLRASNNIDKEHDQKMVPVLIDKIWNDESFDLLKYITKHHIHSDAKVKRSIVNPMDLTQIKRKMLLYSDFNEFYVDICWIVHNCIILFTEDHDITKAARSLLNCIVEGIQHAKECFECYVNANKYPNHWFSMVCGDEPHLIIWVKKNNYWPAKLLSVTGQEVSVRLFGDHSSVKISATNCLLYSESSPSRIPKPSDAYNVALKEANTYIENLTKKFGPFRFAEIKTAFNPALLEYYIAQLIPGSGEYRKMKNTNNVIDTIDLQSDDSVQTIQEADTTTTYSIDEDHHSEDDPNSDGSNAMHNSHQGSCHMCHEQESECETDSQYDLQSNQHEENDVIIIE